ncbi:hypothetical protein BU24DRAFT_492359 [Aaosphaeria arxii CBS 175.79]|uniref:Uncharacterized protein n=1 Tax=Aaosphaeria arxii CBS 175.79 TaxID=1450172 RepID=A0A6A5XU41_9PLEO|nr:uncharacterized protein BU24DRAFT_492359 [Aaosphaeria arxii CBS 175.79]KAF2016231.1 hypothetical protein BU24DRAFT_492359 [Aaosphaeria arxii CBS 175.79]
MVLRLFVQPNEGKHWIVPKRHEPLPANSTIENSVVASTALAAAYTSYSRGFSRRIGHTGGLSAPATFIRASARAGIWCACIGAATNWYYHYAFTTPVVELSQVETTPWKVWEKTDKYTVDDGFLAGAGVGLASGLVSAVFLRRMPVSWFAKCVGMTNVGAFAGITGSHAYFHYKGERQTAATALEEWKKRRNMEFHWIYWNKLFMSRLPPLWQGYVVFNGIFKANSLPEEALKTPEKYGVVGIAAPAEQQESSADGAAQPTAEEEYTGYYFKSYDHSENLRNINLELTRSTLKDMYENKTRLLEDSQWVIAELGRKQHEYCHLDSQADDDERQRRQREIQLLELTFNRLRIDADQVARKIELWELAVQQKVAWESSSTDKSTPAPSSSLKSDDTAAAIKAWTAPQVHINPAAHIPSQSVEEFIKFRDQLVSEIATFEAKEKTSTGKDRKNVTSDLKDARALLRAADMLIWESENKVKKLQQAQEAAATVSAASKEKQQQQQQQQVEQSSKYQDKDIPVPADSGIKKSTSSSVVDKEAADEVKEPNKENMAQDETDAPNAAANIDKDED